jgi:cobalamin synthase
LLGPSWAQAIDWLGSSSYLFLLWSTIVVSLALPFVPTQRKERLAAPTADTVTVAWLCGALSLYALVTSVFGDGYIEAQKHTVLLQTNVLIAIFCLASIAIRIARQRLPRVFGHITGCILRGTAGDASASLGADGGSTQDSQDSNDAMARSS